MIVPHISTSLKAKLSLPAEENLLQFPSLTILRQGWELTWCVHSVRLQAGQIKSDLFTRSCINLNFPLRKHQCLFCQQDWVGPFKMPPTSQFCRMTRKYFPRYMKVWKKHRSVLWLIGGLWAPGSSPTYSGLIWPCLLPTHLFIPELSGYNS